MKTTLRLLGLLLALIPLGLPPAWAQTSACTQTNTLNYATASTGDRRTATETSAGTSFTYSGYASSVPSGQTNLFSVGTTAQLSGQSLIWQQDNTNNAGANTSSVTMTFTRPVNGLTMVLQNIDAGTISNGGSDFIDDLTFEAYINGSTEPTTLTSSNFITGTNNEYVSGGQVRGTVNTPAGNTAANVTASMPNGLTKLVVRYSNTSPYTAGNSRLQTLGINSVAWCAQSDIYALYTSGSPSVVSGGTATYTVQFGNNGPDAAATNVARTVTLPTGAVVTSNGGGTVSGNTINFGTVPSLASGASQSFTYAYRVPAAIGKYDNVAAVSGTTSSDPVANNSAVLELAVTATCNNTVALNYATRATGEDWRNRALQGVPTASSVTRASTTYTSNDNSSTLQVGTLNNVQTLVWNANYTSGNRANNTSTVTYNFDRPVANLRLNVQDIDAIANGGLLGIGTSGFTDEVTFMGNNNGVNVVPAVDKVNPASIYVNVANNVATGVVAAGRNASSNDASVTVTFPMPVTSITLTYRNVTTTATFTTQAIGINDMSWCRVEPIANDITNTSLPGGIGATRIANLTGSADGTIQSYRITALPASAQGALYVNNTVLNTTNFPGLVLTPTQATQLFFAPAATFSGNASFAYTVTDDSGTSDATPATYTIPVTATGASGTPAPCATPGKDGSVASLTVNPDTYYPSTAPQTLNAGATSIAVGAATGTTLTNIEAGDLLLVIQMQGADINSTNTDAYGDGVTGGGASGYLSTASFTAGTYEYVVASSTVTAAAGGTIQLATPLVNGYQNAAATTTAGQRRFQVVRVPQYGNLTLGATISAAAWNGSTGGILVMDVAGVLNLNGFTINATAAGFRGGAGRTQTNANRGDLAYVTTSASNNNGQKGEGIAGTPQYVFNGTALVNTGADGYPSGSNGRGAPGNAGGGGNDNIDNSGGGGGGNGGRGGRGGNNFASNLAIGGEPGASFAEVRSSRLIMGGGGGAGSTNNNSGTPANGLASSGAIGGGIIMVRTGSVIGTGSLIANGAAANNTVADDGSGGGGAGGSILLTAVNTSGLANVTLTANGGTGGTNTGSGTTGYHGPGGGGGGGVVLANGAVAAASSAAGAANGLTSSSNAFGAAAGSVGVSNAQINGSIANSTVGTTCAADVTTTLDGPTRLNPGQPSGNYTVTFTNVGTATANGVVQTVTLPAGVTSVLVPDGAMYNPTTRVITFVSMTGITLSSRASNPYQFSFTTPKQTGDLMLISNVSTTTSEGVNAAANQATLTATLNMAADVAITVATPTNPVTAGQTGTFNVTLSNVGTSAASSPTAQLQLPAGLMGVNVTGTNGVAGTYNPTTGLVTYTFPNGNEALASGFSATSAITFTAPATGPVTATATIGTTTYEAGQTANNVATIMLNITPAFDLATSISGPTSTVAGTLTTFTVLTTNAGPSPASGVTQFVQLPAGLRDVFVSNNGTYDGTSGIVTFPTLATLANGVSVNNIISFAAPATGFTATANVTPTAGDLFPNNNSAAAPATTVAPATSAQANVYTNITLPVVNVAPGDAVIFTVATGNAGPATATDVVQQVALPVGLNNVQVTGGGTYDRTTGIVSFPAASLASGTATSQTIMLTAPAAGTVLAVASVSSTISDPMLANNAVSAAAVVTPQADVATTLQGPQSTVAGQSVTYTVTTSNNGAAVASNVVQLVQIPAGLAGVNAGAGIYDATTGIITFPAIASQAVGSTVTSSITFTAPATGSFTSTAYVSAATPDAVQTNNTASMTTATQRNSDVAVFLTGPATTVVGNPATYAVTTTNIGPSIAAGQTTTVRLPAGLGAGNVTITGGGTYNNTTGVVTFPAVTEQAVGAAGTITNTITFLVPDVAQLTISANAATVAGTNDPSLGNNTAVISTTVGTATLAQVDAQTTITANVTSQTAGQPIVFTVTTTNASTTTEATNVVQQVALPAGLTNVTVEDGAYDPQSGLVTFARLSTQPAGTTRSRTITVNAPGAGPLVARASVSTDNPDAAPANNFATTSVTISARADVATTVSGPATALPGATVTYSVVTLNNGPSAAANVVQTVTLPANVTNVVLPAGATRNGDVVTFPTIASQAAGVAGQVTNSITFTAPEPSFDVTSSVTSATTDVNLNNNTSTQTTALSNQAPVANTVVNSRQSPQGNTAGRLAITALSGRDADGQIAFYTITSRPTAAQGVLYLNGNPVANNQLIFAMDAEKLTFDPAAGYVGNVFFTYTATDNASTVSAPALYQIVVGRDNAAVYTLAAMKGSNELYQNDDVIASVFDVNGGVYNAATPQGIIDNGVRQAVAADQTSVEQLSALGMALDPATGRLYVLDRTKLRAGSYTTNITTTDANGGITTQALAFTIGGQPLPVELVSFAAKAAQQNAGLTWRTASEKNNDHFVVERSIDGLTFVTVGTVKGNGSTSAAHDYHLTDVGAARVAQQLYYRLRQVDQDGTESLSPVRTVTFAREVATAPTLYPNPANTSTKLDLSGLPLGPYQVTVVDMAGRTVATCTVSGGLQSQLQIQQLPTGSYTVLVQGAEGRHVLRFMKE